jgi:protein TonB
LQTQVQDRLLAGTGTATVLGLFGYLLLIGLSGDIQKRVEQSLVLLNIKPPPPPPPPKLHVEAHKAKAAGAASPRNLRNKPTEVVALPPRIVLPPPPPVVSAPKAGLGLASAAGASDRPGPGTGAGGEGNGTGSGGQGDGDGDGGEPPRQIKGRLSAKDLPPNLIEEGVTRTVGVRYQVESDGHVSYCKTIASSGNVALDQMTCRLIEQRFSFRPSRDAMGRPVRSTIEEDHSWIFDSSAERQ